jgi:hypothetical protein
MGAYEWLEREVFVPSRKGGTFEGSGTGHPDIHHECVSAAQNVVQGNLLNDVQVLVGA